MGVFLIQFETEIDGLLIWLVVIIMTNREYLFQLVETKKHNKQKVSTILDTLEIDRVSFNSSKLFLQFYSVVIHSINHL